jgi:hypothetical protein
MLFAIDAAYTFDEGDLSAEQIMAVTAVNLHGHFGRVADTSELPSLVGGVAVA